MSIIVDGEIHECRPSLSPHSSVQPLCCGSTGNHGDGSVQVPSPAEDPTAQSSQNQPEQPRLQLVSVGRKALFPLRRNVQGRKQANHERLRERRLSGTNRQTAAVIPTSPERTRRRKTRKPGDPTPALRTGCCDWPLQGGACSHGGGQGREMLLP